MSKHRYYDCWRDVRCCPVGIWNIGIRLSSSRLTDEHKRDVLEGHDVKVMLDIIEERTSDMSWTICGDEHVIQYT